MGGINMGRVFLGGLVAGVILWICEGVASVLYMDDMQAAMQSHGLSMEIDAEGWALSILVSLMVGWLGVWFYAACRPRLGAGPKAAACVALALWLAVTVVSLIGYHMIGLFPDGMLVLWGLVGLVEMVLAVVVGAWVYKED